jgi:hypothetical protein
MSIHPQLRHVITEPGGGYRLVPSVEHRGRSTVRSFLTTSTTGVKPFS